MSTDKRHDTTDDRIARLRTCIRERLIELNVAAREIDRRAGFSIGYVGNILEGKNKSPGTEKIMRLAEALGLQVSDLLPETNGAQMPRPVTKAQHFMPQNNAPVVPLYAVQTVLEEILLPLIAEPVGLVATIPALSLITGAYAFTVPNDLNAPRYFAGETVYISPVAVPKPGDFVFLRTTDGRAGIARLVRTKDSRITTRVLNGEGKLASDKTRDRSEFASIHRIVGSVG